VKVETPGGEKSKRFIDVQGTNSTTKAQAGVQVGKQNLNGTPVSREVRAMNDIKVATGGVPLTFWPYNRIK
jgi:hypothetical protein